MGDTDKSPPLAGAEIHGFATVKALNIEEKLKKAAAGWFRPNEIHAILSNHNLLKLPVHPEPVQNPSSGSVFLYDRKVVRNFRKDGHNWRKKKDGKSVQEAHEKLKVGDEERVHVYYARGEDDPDFYRRCFWLLDSLCSGINCDKPELCFVLALDHLFILKFFGRDFFGELERIVLVHYLYVPRTSKENAFSPGALVIGSDYSTPLPRKNLNLSSQTPDSNSISQHSEVSGGGIVSEEFNSGNNNKNNEWDQLNTLEWDDLLQSPSEDNSQEGASSSLVSWMDPGSIMNVNNGTFTPMQGPSNQLSGALTNYANYSLPPTSNQLSGALTNYASYSLPPTSNQLYGTQLPGLYGQEALGQIDEPLMEPILTQNLIFTITDVSPAWAYCTKETKVLVVGDFDDQFRDLHQLRDIYLYCSIGGRCVNVELIKAGVFRVLVPPNTPGSAELYMTLDGQNPISQVITFTYLSDPKESKPELELKDIHLQTRLLHLLFSSDKISSMSNKLTQKQLKEATNFASQTSPVIEKYWTGLIKQINEGNATNKGLLEMVLRNKVQEWLLEKVSEGCKITPLDEEGQGVIHLCAMLDYNWAVWMFALSGLSLDFRDSAGWTALHWAAFYGRERMVASLLSAGANPSLVTDPTPDYSGGSTVADLADKQGFEGLAAYLAEKGITAHFEAMSLHGNIDSDTNSKSTSTSRPDDHLFTNLGEEELCLKESLAAYRNAADAASKIQAAFRERTLKLQTDAVQMENPESDAKCIVAALKIQNAYKNYNRKKVMRAAARIQSHYRTWKIRKDFLVMRNNAIHIQAVFRGHQVRRQYKKIIWSVGVVEKAILRWRHKRRGLRGMQSAEVAESMRIDPGSSSSTGEEMTGEEDFFAISRRQAEDRLSRSVTRVQALFRSYKAQQEYRRMKMTHEQAQKEFNDGRQGDWD